jgi:hypothetical protein
VAISLKPRAVIFWRILVDPVLGVDREGQRGGGTEHLDVADLDLDLTGGQVRVHVLGST